MDSIKSSHTDNSNEEEKTEPGPAQSKGTTARRRANIKVVQNVQLIWLDHSIDDNSTDYHNTVNQLRYTVNDITTFTDDEECIQFISTITDNKICIIISRSLAADIVPRIHNMFQVDFIFITSDDENEHNEWINEWPKIKGVFTEISSICEVLKQTSQQCEQNAISISFVPTNSDISSENLNRLDPTFMYTQILKEILLTIQFEPQHIKEFIDYCRTLFVDNDREIKIINKFEQKYHDKTPIWWYTYDCFLYPMLNRALRLTDIDIIIKMGFFID